MSYGRRHRRGRRGRLPKPVTIPNPTKVRNFIPHPITTGTTITIEPAELEAMRLVDLEDLSQEEAGDKMGVSRGTIWRLVKNARKKVAQALTEGRPLAVTNNL
ncbi:MAG: DUF134 domain-containing protein [Candidatus Bathyarchaeota archaeon]|nr:DUF134 domain-containing protein [Candidatus Bathyarchaeum tardum]WGM88627.1 MAG: DUF134 domain-containing protein [Candidatus Bathyarchaeum tardum]WNZ29117.1 MAG: DUF134 domain-containing protein [Candidatus Bathyarchaeota archaeon]